MPNMDLQLPQAHMNMYLTHIHYLQVGMQNLCKSVGHCAMISERRPEAAPDKGVRMGWAERGRACHTSAQALPACLFLTNSLLPRQPLYAAWILET